MIKTMLDTDLYKFTMQQVVFHKFTDVNVRYAFKLRNPNPAESLLPLMSEIDDEIMKLEKLRMGLDEINYLEKLPFMTPGYVEFLRYHRMDPDRFVTVGQNYDEELIINIHGPWLNTILFEVPILSIVSEVWSKYYHPDVIEEGRRRLREKTYYIEDTGEDEVWFLDNLRFADFGTRRRYSYDWQDEVIKTLKTEFNDDGYPILVGTSNVHLAMKHGLKPIGTMAHEFIQASQALVRLRDSQKFAFQTWADVYRGDLGIALSDTLGMDAFMEDFDKYFSKLFDGARHDSGDPIVWGKKLIEHYKSMGIDPMTKKAVFSDGLDFTDCRDIMEHFTGKINTSFGIGTNLTNDMGYKAMQIVIKMTEAGYNGHSLRPVAKISDSPGKQMCNDENYLKYLKSVFKIPEVVK